MGTLQDREATRQWYSHLSQVYEPLVSETFWPPAVQKRILDEIATQSDDRVLDVGCGTGLTSGHVTERADECDALDISRPQLARADGNDVDARFVRGDAQQLPYADDTFDAVVSVGAILYFPSPVAALTEARRVTRPGGEIVVAGFNRPSVPSLNPLENWASLANEALFHTYDSDEARETFTEAGWRGIESTATGPFWHPRLALVTTARAE